MHLIHSRPARQRSSRKVTTYFLVALFFAGAYLWRPAAAQTPATPTTKPTEASNISMVSGESTGHSTFRYFGFLSDPKFSSGERGALFASLIVAPRVLFPTLVAASTVA